jgi:hypothetical protein
MILELHFEGPSGGFRELVSSRHEFSLAGNDILADSVRSRIARWSGDHSRLLHARIEFSAEEWRTWSVSPEYRELFTQFVAERTGRAIGLPRALSEYLGCDDVSCGTYRRSAQPELVEA